MKNNKVYKISAFVVVTSLAMLAAKPVFSATHNFSFTINAGQNLGAVNPDLLGTYESWWYSGDGILDSNGNHRPEVIALAAARKPSVFRYWASDWFEW